MRGRVRLGRRTKGAGGAAPAPRKLRWIAHEDLDAVAAAGLGGSGGCGGDQCPMLL